MKSKKLYQNRFAQPETQVNQNEMPQNQPKSQEKQIQQQLQNQQVRKNSGQSQQSQQSQQNVKKEPSEPQRYFSSTLINKRKQIGYSQLNHEAIPRPSIKITDCNQIQKFNCNAKAGIPPNPYQLFTSEDQGNSVPELIRCTNTLFATEPGLINETRLPVGVIVQPFADLVNSEVPVVEYEKGPFRCSRCKCYINPYFKFIDQGNFAICNICEMSNKVENDYYGSLNEFGQRKDKYERSELHRGSYEFVAPAQYINKELCPLYLIFCLELTQETLITGAIQQVLSSLSLLIEYLPCPERTEICIMTFNSKMTFYKIPQDLNNEPQIIIISDLDDAFAVYPREVLFINASTGLEKLQYIISKLQQTLSQLIISQLPQQSCWSSVLSTCFQILDPLPGKIQLFTSKHFDPLKYRQHEEKFKKTINSDKEFEIYKNLLGGISVNGRDCLEKSVGIDWWDFGATPVREIAELVAASGGQLYSYTKYNQEIDGERLHYDISRNLTRYTAKDIIMTLRTSNGLTLEGFYTGLGKVNCRDLQLAVMDADQTATIVFKQEDKISGPEAYIQYAVLYTSPFGQRIIRVLNLAFTIESNLTNIFKSFDGTTLSALILRKTMHQIKQFPIKNIQDNISGMLIDSLHSYRTNCAYNAPNSQLVLPDPLRLIPQYLFSSFKRNLLKTGVDVNPDDRYSEILQFSTCSLFNLMTKLYPKLMAIHNIYEKYEKEGLTPGTQKDNHILLPSTLPLSVQSIDSDGIYLLDTCDHIVLYIMNEANPLLIQQLLGCNELSDIMDWNGLTQLENDYSIRINAIIDEMRKLKNSSYQNVILITEADPMKEQEFVLNNLIEDEIKQQPCIGNYLCFVHKSIQNKFD